ncbi:hypothetical protein EDB92DRAFT_2116952, partial [Lactarius akahatsu]
MMPGSAVADIRNSLGVAFIGLLISTSLFGLTILQTWVYFWNYRKRDPKALKFFIVFITVTDTINIILGAYTIYWYLVLNFGDVESLDHILWALSAQTAIGTVAVASLQMFVVRTLPLTCYMSNEAKLLRKTSLYSEPEYYLPNSHRKLPLSYFTEAPVIVVSQVVLVAISFSFGMLSVAKDFAIKRFSKFHTVLWVPCVGLGIVAVTELLIAASMCWSLYRKRTGFGRTDSIVMTLMAYTINSNLLTSLLGTAAIISFVVSPSSLFWLAFCWVMNECSINSMLALLNSRDYIRDRTSANKTFSMSSIRHEQRSEAHGSKPRQTGVSVTVHHSATSDLSRNNSGPSVEPTFEIPKPMGLRISRSTVRWLDHDVLKSLEDVFLSVGTDVGN